MFLQKLKESKELIGAVAGSLIINFGGLGLLEMESRYNLNTKSDNDFITEHHISINPNNLEAKIKKNDSIDILKKKEKELRKNFDFFNTKSQDGIIFVNNLKKDFVSISNSKNNLNLKPIKNNKIFNEINNSETFKLEYRKNIKLSVPTEDDFGNILKQVEKLDEENLENTINEYQKLINVVKTDLKDGKLDGSYVKFVIGHEYYKLSSELAKRNLQPTFNLEEIINIYDEKVNESKKLINPNKTELENIKEIIKFNNRGKFYHLESEGSVIDSLLNNIMTCHSGTDLNISILRDLFPNQKIGINQYLLVTNEGTIMGHVQPYLYNYKKIIESTKGNDFLQDFKVGEVFSLEDEIIKTESKTKPLGFYFKKLFSNKEEKILKGKKRFLFGVPTEIKSMLGFAENKFFRGIIKEDEIVNLDEVRKIQNINTDINYQIYLKQMNLINSLEQNIAYLENKLDNAFKSTFPKKRKDFIDKFLANPNFQINNRLSKEFFPIYQENLPSYEQVFQAIKTGKTDLEFNILHQNFNTKQFLSHYKFMKSNNFKRTKNQKNIKSKLKKLKQETLDSEIQNFLLTFSDFDIKALIETPDKNFGQIMEDLINNKYAISENEKFSSQKSNRKLFCNKAYVVNFDPRFNKKILKNRLNVLEDVFIGEKSDKKFEVREQYEKDSFINYNTSIQNGGKTGLSQGIIKDSVDFFGEEEAIDKLDKYLQRKDLEIEKDEYYEILKNYDSELYYEKSVEKLEDIIKDEFDNSKDINLKLASAKYLHKKNKIDNQKLNEFYINHLKSHEEIDVNLIEDLLNSGLEKDELKNYLNSELDKLKNLKNVVGLNYEENNLDENVKVFNNLENILMIADNLNLDNLKEKVYDINLNYMKDFIDFSQNNNENLNYGNLLNAIQLTNSKEFSDDERFDDLTNLFEFGHKNNAIRLLAPLIQKRSKAFDIIIEKINNEIEREENKSLINGVNIIKKNVNLYNQDEARIYFKNNKDFFEKTLNTSNILNLLFYNDGWSKHKLKKFFDISNTCLEFTLLNSIRKEETIIFNDLKDYIFDSADIKLLSNFDKDFEKNITKNLSFYTPTKFLEEDVYGYFVFEHYIKNLKDKANFNFNFDRTKVRSIIEENLYYIMPNKDKSYLYRKFYNKRIHNNLSKYENYRKFSYDYLPENIPQDFVDSFKENLNYNLYTSDTNSFMNGLFLYKHGFLKLNDNKDGFTPTQKGTKYGF